MRKISLFISALALPIIGLCQQQIQINPDNQQPYEITLLSSNSDEILLELNINSFYLAPANGSSVDSKIVVLEKSGRILKKGVPDLVRIAQSVIIPDLADMEVEVTESEYLDYNNILIAPSKGNLTRDINPDDIPYSYSKAYNTDAFFPGTQAELSEPYILRDYRGQTVLFYPFQYNPVQKKLRVLHHMIVRVSKGKNLSTVNPFVRTKTMSVVNEDYEQVYRNQFINYDAAKYTAIPERGSILVICAPAYTSQMAPYVQWKNRIGFPTTMVTTATTGTTNTAIKSYVQSYYNNSENNLTYLLLVGDASHIPPITSGMAGPSDNAYGYLAGSDHYPDIYVGRFSAESTTDVNTQVERTIDYELTPSTSNNWLNRTLAIASSQGPGDDNEMDYEHQRNIQTDLMNYQYVTKYEMFDGSQGALDASGDPTTTMVGNQINSGVGIITYTGHGSDFAFSTSGYSTSNIPNLTNAGKLPFIWSVACVNGNFPGQTCFAEVWLRSRNASGAPIGAVATLMSTINQSWNPPMEGQDEMVDVLVESYAGNIKRTFGGLSMSGCMKMNDTYGTDGNNMTDTWTLFGDPSLMVRTDTPKTLIVTHASTVLIGSTQLLVNCNKNGAFVTVTLNDVIIGTGIVSGGSATINFSALTAVDSLWVTATEYNYFPYQGEVPIVPASGPYINYASHSINDAAGNNNGQADYGESMLLSISVENVGVATATSVVGTIASTNPFITITDNTYTYGNVNAGVTAAGANGYALSISNTVPDQEVINISMLNTSGSNSWNSNFNLIANAPSLSIGTLSLTELSGNGNGKADPDESLSLLIPSLNNGHAAHINTIASISTTSSYVTIVTNTDNLGSLAASGSIDANFSIDISPTCPLGTSVDITMTLGSGAYLVTRTFYIRVGQADEDFETGDFTQWAWTFSGNQPWVITTVNPYEGTDCAKSGTLSSSQSSTMQIIMTAQAPDSISFYRKVSSEQDYDFLKFYIDGTEKGSWSGEIGWERFAYAVTAAQHTYKWTYATDYMIENGDNTAWVDYVIFPPVPTPANINESIDFSFNVYPNPADDQLLVLIIASGNDAINVEMYDLTGRIVKSQTFISNNNMEQLISIDASDLCNGIYTLTVRHNENSISRLIMIGH